ncbi:MAG: type III-A CRISPR-associated RAMP protein Csm5 [Prevotellaceae bacterium]|jgi:CRISPR type III-A-associated RAMP protein Csm5|nr:type III-A CRISPR-associated RAMP protein Csm5 [Prevotellaceae bacterium]
MSAVKIETLTPVHIGSGNMLYNNTDFVGVRIGNEPCLAVISEEKIWKLLGEQHLDNWLQAITERKPLRDFLQKFAPNAKSIDYSKRRMPLFADLKPNDTLKETLHNGMGLPYIPGSSIKGAIRTAILASVVKTIQDKENAIQEFKNGKTLVSAKKIETKAFGIDPNSDAFRFIHVGDAYFEKDSEIAMRLINLNVRNSENDLMDKSKPQLVEAICQDVQCSIQLKIAREYYDFVKQRFDQVGRLPVNSADDLFRMINSHTRKLVEDEIEIWNNIAKNKIGGEGYIEQMQNIFDTINACEDGKSCVLRIGHTSGWRFITGAWAEKLWNFKDVVVPASRPKNHNYENYDFPKTRRLDTESYIMGFVKLTLL